MTDTASAATASTAMYLFYGDGDAYRLEFHLSLLSALTLQRRSPGAEVRFCVVTDRDDLDPDLPVEIIHVDAAELADWRTTPSGIRYNHRAKLRSMAEVMDRYPEDRVTFIDTDTIFERPPADLFARVDAGHAVFHQLECPQIATEPIWGPILEQIGDGIEVGGVPIRPTSAMYNSGVIGTVPEHRPLIDLALEMTDHLVPIDPSIMNLEQFSFCRVFDEHTDIRSSNDIIRHYCDHSRRFVHLGAERLFDGDFSAANFERLLDADLDFDRFDFPPIGLTSKLAAAALAGVSGFDPMVRWAVLCEVEALVTARNDRRVADCWARMAADEIRLVDNDAADHRLGPLRRRLLFLPFSGRHIEDRTWLDGETRRAWRALEPVSSPELVAA